MTLEVFGDYYPTCGFFQYVGNIVAFYVEQSGFFIRPACQDEDGTHLDDVDYEFIDYLGFSGNLDYNTYIDAPSHGNFQVRFWKDNLQATVIVESHSAKPFAGIVVTLRPGKVHNINTGESFATIQDAINDSETSALHTITVDPGVYSENVKITMPLTIKSTSGSPGDAIVQAKNSDDHVFTYEPTACWVGFGCSISDFTIKGGVDGVYLGRYTNHCNISNNKLLDNNHGIYLDNSANNTIINNDCSQNNDDGIYLSYSSYNQLSNNICNDGFVGVYAEYSSNNKITNNTLENNQAGIRFGFESDDNTIKNNNVSHNEEGFDFYVSSTGNKIYLNNFINNSCCVGVEGNLFNSPEKITYIYSGNIFANYTGNYWDDYTDVDTANDGIWDHPYSIYYEEKDYYPLVEPFENYIPTSTKIGTLVVDVYNVNGNPAAEVGGTTSVELIRSGETSTIAEQTIDAESKATFSNVPAGEYYINVRHDPPMEQGDEEFWGQRKDIYITTGTIAAIDFYRHTPYVEEFYAEESPVVIDTPAKINVTIKVPSNYTGTEAHVKTSITIRNETGHEVHQDMSSSRIVQRGDDTTFSFSYTPTETGVYSGLAKAYVVGSVELCTDNCGWVELFEVEYPPTQIKLNAIGGEPAVFVDVTILDDGAKIAEGITDLNGTVKFYLPPGGYNITFLEDEESIQAPITKEFDNITLV